MPYRIIAKPSKPQPFAGSEPRYVSKFKDFEETLKPEDAREFKTRRGAEQAIQRNYKWPGYSFEIEVIDRSFTEV